VEVVIYAENALSGTVIAGATAVLTRASGEQLTRQTDVKGKVRFVIDNLTEPEDVSVTITAVGFEPATESGTLEPGEDMDGTVQLMPIPPTPPRLLHHRSCLHRWPKPCLYKAGLWSLRGGQAHYDSEQ
jgi:hypothetical protein